MPNLLRIESESGYGPFCDSDLYLKKMGTKYHWNLPGTTEDFKRKDYINKKKRRDKPHRLGIHNACLYLLWFGPFVSLLKENNYKLVKVEVKRYKIGKSGLQVLFKPKHIIKKTTLWQ